MNTSRSLSKFKPFALVAAGVLLGSFFSGMLRPAPALAQSKDLPPEKILNSAENTRLMMVGINQINERLGRIESTLNSGLKVKVTEMPAMPKETK